MPLKRRVATVLLLAAFVRSAAAKIGDAPEAYAARYGDAIKKAFDAAGSGLGVYRTKDFKEIRVTFVKGTSAKEVYKYADSESVPQTALEAIRTENPGEYIFDVTGQTTIESSEPDESSLADLDRKPSGREVTYSGVLKEKGIDDQRWAVISDRGTVIELPILTPGNPQQIKLVAGRRYSVTLLEKLADDIDTTLGVVSKREHVDWFDAVDDAGLLGIQQLVRITEGDAVIFDRSVCSLHQLKMELRTVEISYGMYAPASWAESYCMGHFPHFRDFALGGCLEGDAQTTSIYICPKCVAECKEYARQHPEKAKPN